MIKALIAALALTLVSWSAPVLATTVEDASVVQPQLEIQYQLADVYVRGYTRKDGIFGCEAIDAMPLGVAGAAGEADTEILDFMRAAVAALRA